MQVFMCDICKNPNCHRNGKEHKTRKDQQIFYKCNICNNTINITLYCITTRKAAKKINNVINVVDGQGLANNHDRQIRGQTNFRSTFVMLKQK